MYALPDLAIESAGISKRTIPMNSDMVEMEYFFMVCDIDDCLPQKYKIKCNFAKMIMEYEKMSCSTLVITQLIIMCSERRSVYLASVDDK